MGRGRNSKLPGVQGITDTASQISGRSVIGSTAWSDLEGRPDIVRVLSDGLQNARLDGLSWILNSL